MTSKHFDAILMSMNQVRTTVSLPDDTHTYLMQLAFQNKKTLGELIDGLVRYRNFLADKSEVEKQIVEFQTFCRKLAKKGRTVDFVKAIREERDGRAGSIPGRM